MAIHSRQRRAGTDGHWLTGTQLNVEAALRSTPALCARKGARVRQQETLPLVIADPFPTPSVATNEPLGQQRAGKPQLEGCFFHATEIATFINQAFFNSPTLTSPFWLRKASELLLPCCCETPLIWCSPLS
jgi:hypothetical protein